MAKFDVVEFEKAPILALTRGIKKLPFLLMDDEGWKGLYIDYQQPTVLRLWRPWEEGRLYLHKILPCKNDKDAYLHPHPWPSAMNIVEGKYLMEFGIGPGLEDTARYLSSFLLCSGSVYDMTDKDLWHRIVPFEPTYSVMYTGKPWNRPMPIEEIPPQRDLTLEEKTALLEKFRMHYRIS